VLQLLQLMPIIADIKERRCEAHQNPRFLMNCFRILMQQKKPCMLLYFNCIQNNYATVTQQI
ncbi:MAG TPA: hypothetical protein VGK38_06150, partial [Prolixibacteraceae bacterium]